MGLFTGEIKKSKIFYQLIFRCRFCNKTNPVNVDMKLELPYETYLKNYVNTHINTATLQHCLICGNINVHDLISVTQPSDTKQSIFDGANKKEKQILKDAGVEEIDEDYFKSEKHKNKTVSVADQLFIKKS